MVFYFTATRNCLYVARQIEDNPISIPQIINKDILNFADEKIGIVAPINKIKLTKRIMYGRSSFLLLKAKILLNEHYYQFN